MEREISSALANLTQKYLERDRLVGTMKRFRPCLTGINAKTTRGLGVVMGHDPYSFICIEQLPLNILR